MDWDKLRIFHAVADAGSLTHAGETLNLSQSAISRQIRALEYSLDVTLFHRHARGLILTEQGELLHEATKSVSKRIEATAARIRDSEERVEGELRVTTTVGFGTLWLMPRLAGLLEKYPDLKIDLMLEERVLDLPMREADIAIRMKEPSQADLVRKRIMTVRMMLFATRSYVERHGSPTVPPEMSGHRLICQNLHSAQVSAGAVMVRDIVAASNCQLLTVNNYFGVLQGTVNDLGIGSLPNYVAQEHPELVRVLPDVASEPVPVYLAYPEELRHSRRIEAFRDFVESKIQDQSRARRDRAPG